MVYEIDSTVLEFPWVNGREETRVVYVCTCAVFGVEDGGISEVLFSLFEGISSGQFYV